MESRGYKKENLRLTYQNDEFIEKAIYLDHKFLSLAQQCKASKEDLEAVETMTHMKKAE